jgi:acyl dehydratase
VPRAEKRDWITPSAGDTIHAESEVVEARRSKSRPDRTRIRVKKRDGTVALIYTRLCMVKRRELTA